jgi:hypothetical protein
LRKSTFDEIVKRKAEIEAGQKTYAYGWTPQCEHFIDGRKNGKYINVPLEAIEQAKADGVDFNFSEETARKIEDYLAQKAS